MTSKMPKIPCKRPAPPPPPATLREFEKFYEFEHSIRLTDSHRYPGFRCVIWASDPKVLKKYLIEKGKFTLNKLMRPSLYSKFKNPESDYWIFLAPLKSEMKKRTIILFSEIIDDNTILLLTNPTILPKLLRNLLHESPEYDIMNIPIPVNFTWHYYAERYTNRLGDQQEEHSTYSCDAHFSFKDASVNFTGDYQNVKRLYDMVMKY